MLVERNLVIGKGRLVSHNKLEASREESCGNHTIPGTHCVASVVVWGTVPAKQQEEELRFKATFITIPKL